MDHGHTGDSPIPWEERAKQLEDELENIRRAQNTDHPLGEEGEEALRKQYEETSKELFYGSSMKENIQRLEDALPQLKEAYDEGQVVTAGRLLVTGWGFPAEFETLPDGLKEVVGKILKENDWIVK